MIKHIVCWKIKETYEGKTKNENLLRMKHLLEGLISKIDEIQYLEVGINDLTAPKDNYDIILITHFNSFDDLNKYQMHPEHLVVADFIKNIRETRACVDYEF